MLTKEQQELVDRHALVMDTNTNTLIDEHLKTALINDVFFGDAPADISDPYFRGMLAGLETKSNYIHERAEIMRNQSLNK